MQTTIPLKQKCGKTVCGTFFIIFAIFFFHTSVPAQPAAVFNETEWEFDPIAEGERILHTYIIKNSGTSDLQLNAARTTCSCTTVTFDKVIPKGEEGRITVDFDSNGYAGKTAHVGIRVTTNDPATPVANLTLKGNVNQVVTILPKIVKLEGPSGQNMKQKVIIQPSENYPFEITGISALKGENVSFTLGKSPDEKAYELTVNFKADKKRMYFDNILLNTDSPYKPQIRIAVFARVTG